MNGRSHRIDLARPLAGWNGPRSTSKTLDRVELASRRFRFAGPDSQDLLNHFDQLTERKGLSKEVFGSSAA